MRNSSRVMCIRGLFLPLLSYLACVFSRCIAASRPPEKALSLFVGRIELRRPIWLLNMLSPSCLLPTMLLLQPQLLLLLEQQVSLSYYASP